MDRLDLGGGLGIPYERTKEPPPPPAAYAETVRRATDGLGVRLIFEPGRMIVGNAGILVTSVLYTKDGASSRFLVVDAAMNDLIRPALYDAWHDILPVSEPAPGTEVEPMDVVGPVCETGDRFARGRPLPPAAPGDLMAVMSAGAYGAVQASAYNSRLLVPEVLVSGDRFEVVRRRPSFDELFAHDRVPDWLGAQGDAC
jgi:diaminopimelate decarboxylase